MKRIWTKYRDYLPCEYCQYHYDEKSKHFEGFHKECYLWLTGWRVGLRKFLWFKWLEFTKN